MITEKIDQETKKDSDQLLNASGVELPLPEITAAEILANLGEAALNCTNNSLTNEISNNQSE